MVGKCELLFSAILPKELDEKVAKLHFPALRAVLTVLGKEQGLHGCQLLTDPSRVCTTVSELVRSWFELMVLTFFTVHQKRFVCTIHRFTVTRATSFSTTPSFHKVMKFEYSATRCHSGSASFVILILVHRTCWLMQAS